MSIYLICEDWTNLFQIYYPFTYVGVNSKPTNHDVHNYYRKHRGMSGKNVSLRARETCHSVMCDISPLNSSTALTLLMFS